MKRENYISWDEYFMGVALITQERSKDPNSQVGCCIASDDNRILSLGYNGAPRGLHDDLMKWNREGSFIDTKYAYVCHSELNGKKGFSFLFYRCQFSLPHCRFLQRGNP